MSSFTSRVPGRSVPNEPADTIAALVDEAACYYYKHTWCLHRAAAKSVFLRLHGVEAQVAIGYCPMPFLGHAWVEVGGAVITDKPQVQRVFRLIDRF